MSRYRELRKELGLTQAQLAQITGVAQATISDRETGRARTTREALMALRYLRMMFRSLTGRSFQDLLEDPSWLEE